jgi:hypothetical protein
MATTTAAARAASPQPRWWARETRLGRHLYPLRAIAVTATVGAATAAAGVVGAVSLLVD